MSEGQWSEDDFSMVILSKIDPERELPTDIFLKVDNRFIKFKNKGDCISIEKYDLFVSKGVSTIYVLNDEIMDFLSWINDIKQEEVETLVNEVGEENRGFFERAVGTKEKIYEVYFEEELNEEIVASLQSNVEEFVAEIKQNPITAQAIAVLAQKNRTIADHSVNVANLAVYLAMALGNNHQFVLENVYMGAIFHDYGKAKIPEHILNNESNNMFSAAIQGHPEASVRMLRKTKGVPEQVVQIILQHHEQFNGYGYPKGLVGDEIYDLAQIVSIANTFDNILVESKHLNSSDKFKKAIKVIEYDKGKSFNPKFYPRVTEALEIAFQTLKNKNAA